MSISKTKAIFQNNLNEIAMNGGSVAERLNLGAGTFRKTS